MNIIVIVRNKHSIRYVLHRVASLCNELGETTCEVQLGNCTITIRGVVIRVKVIYDPFDLHKLQGMSRESIVIAHGSVIIPDLTMFCKARFSDLVYIYDLEDLCVAVIKNVYDRNKKCLQVNFNMI